MLCTTAISTRSELYRPLVRDFTNSMNSPTEYTRAELTQVYLVQFSSCAVNKALGMLSHRRILSSISILLRHARLIDIQKRLFPHQYMDCVKLQRSVTHYLLSGFHWTFNPNHFGLWRIASRTPGLRLPSQSQDNTAVWPVPNCIAWRQTGPDLSVWRPWAGSLLEAPTHPQMLQFTCTYNCNNN